MNAAGLKTNPAAILLGGLACGVLDISQAFLAWGLIKNVPPYRILQSVASGWFGPASFEMGWKSAVAGVGFHFLISFGAAAVYWVASRWIRFLLEHAIISGMIFGECVFFFMNYAVLPLSAIHRFPTYTLPLVLTGPIGHTFLVGLPIALLARKYSH